MTDKRGESWRWEEPGVRVGWDNVSASLRIDLAYRVQQGNRTRGVAPIKEVGSEALTDHKKKKAGR